MPDCTKQYRPKSDVMECTGGALIAHITHVPNMRKKNDMLFNNETSTYWNYFASLPYGLLLKEIIDRFRNRATLNKKNLLPEGANSFLQE